MAKVRIFKGNGDLFKLFDNPKKYTIEGQLLTVNVEKNGKTAVNKTTLPFFIEDEPKKPTATVF